MMEQKFKAGDRVKLIPGSDMIYTDEQEQLMMCKRKGTVIELFPSKCYAVKFKGIEGYIVIHESKLAAAPKKQKLTVTVNLDVTPLRQRMQHIYGELHALGTEIDKMEAILSRDEKE